MFQLLFDTKLQGSKSIESFEDSRCSSLEYIGEQYECAQLVDSNSIIELQHCFLLFVVSPWSVKFDNQPVEQTNEHVKLM
jgi:hypothetical protein